MRFRFGPPPLDPTFEPRPPWRPLREPRRIVVVLVLALPLGLLAALGFVLLAVALRPSHGLVIAPDGVSLVLALLLLAPLHEACHALIVPGSLTSPKLIVGVWPKAVVGYVHYEGELGRARFLLVAFCPLVVVSVVSLAAAALFPSAEQFWLMLGLLNALGTGGDLLGALSVLSQVPRGARLRNQGWRTYWRPGR